MVFERGLISINKLDPVKLQEHDRFRCHRFLRLFCADCQPILLSNSIALLSMNNQRQFIWMTIEHVILE